LSPGSHPGAVNIGYQPTTSGLKTGPLSLGNVNLAGATNAALTFTLLTDQNMSINYRLNSGPWHTISSLHSNFNAMAVPVAVSELRTGSNTVDFQTLPTPQWPDQPLLEDVDLLINGGALPPPPSPPPPAPSSADLQLLSQPQRLVDTRLLGGPAPAGSTQCYTVASQVGVPANASGVILNVTSVGAADFGWLTLFPAGQGVPTTSTLNFDPRTQAIANNAIVRVGSGGQVCVNVGHGSSHVILDIAGFLTP
jgi:hypothetical protein